MNYKKLGNDSIPLVVDKADTAWVLVKFTQNINMQINKKVFS